MVEGLIDNEPPRFGAQTRKYQHVRRVVETAQTPLGLKSDLFDSHWRIHPCHHVQLFSQPSVADRQDHTSIADVRRKPPHRIH